MALCYSSCFNVYTSPASAACPNMLDMGCVCKNMNIFNDFSCCIQKNCGMGVVGETAWGWVQGMCAGNGGAPASKLSCSSGSSGSGSGTYGGAGTPVPKASSVRYTAPAGYGGGVFAPIPSATQKPNTYGALKMTNSAPSSKGKKFGVAGALSLGFGALLLVAM